MSGGPTGHVYAPSPPRTSSAPSWDQGLPPKRPHHKRAAVGFEEAPTRAYEEYYASKNVWMQTISQLRVEREALHNVLDRVPIGVLLLDRTGKPLLVNRSASETVASKDGLAIGRHGFSAANSEENRQLKRLVAEATATGSRKGSQAGGVLSVSRPSLRRAFSLLIHPVAAIFVTDPERNVRTDRALLRDLHGFTPAEALVACKLMQGESVNEAADDLEVTINTARTHVRHLLEKTETHRHRELVRLLLLGCAQIQSR